MQTILNLCWKHFQVFWCLWSFGNIPFLKNYFCSTTYGEWHRLFPFGYSINEPYVTDMIHSIWDFIVALRLHVWTGRLDCLAHSVASGLGHTSKGLPEATIGCEVLLLSQHNNNNKPPCKICKNVVIIFWIQNEFSLVTCDLQDLGASKAENFAERFVGNFFVSHEG